MKRSSRRLGFGQASGLDGRASFEWWTQLAPVRILLDVRCIEKFWMAEPAQGAL